MNRPSDNERSNPISRAFSKLFDRDDANKDKASKPSAQVRSAPDTAQGNAPGVQTKGATAPPQRSAAAGRPLAGAAEATARPAATPQANAGTAPNRSAAASTGAAALAAKAAPRTYTVAKGDSLSKIAQQVYGRADRWTLIFEANRGTITNPDLIHPGQVLVLPDASKLH